jgi:4-amino-4-deoxy-L-arabinose transferase-like glycosyltransferase
MPATSSVNPSPDLRVNAWIARRWSLLVIGVLAVSASLRVVYFVQAAGGPLASLHRWDQTDMNHFDSWAKQIAAGDWMSRNVDPPLHDWHVEVVRRQLLSEPENAARLAAAGVTLDDPTMVTHPALKDEARTRWNTWIGNGRLYQDPLYPYIVAVMYGVIGEDPRLVFAGQMALGVMCVWLVMLIAKRCFGEIAGIVAGLLAALNGPMMFYEFLLLRETAVMFAGLAIVWLAMLAHDASPQSKWRWLVTGLAIGVAMLLKSQFLLLLAGLLALMAIEHRAKMRTMIRPAAMMVIGAAAALSPLMIRNLAIGFAPLAGAGNGGPSIVLSGAEDATSMSWGLDHVGEIMDRTGGGLGSTMLATLQTHDSAGSVLNLMWGKFRALWHWYEFPNNENFYYGQLVAPVLEWMPVTWVVIAPLGVIGLVLGATRWRVAGPLFVLVICNIALLVIPLHRR